MKLIQQIIIDKIEYPIISFDLAFSLNSTTNASFKIQSNKPLFGLVEFALGWEQDELVRVFVGFVTKQITVSPKEQIIFARDFSFVLEKTLYLGLQNVTATDVLEHISKKTKINFLLPEQDYMKQQSFYFYNLACGFFALNSLAKVFSIKKLFWYQQGNEGIFVGSWHDSIFAKKQMVFPDSFFKKHSCVNSAVMPIIPTCRPGVLFNRGIVDKVRLSKKSMEISWKLLDA